MKHRLYYSNSSMPNIRLQFSSPLKGIIMNKKTEKVLLNFIKINMTLIFYQAIKSQNCRFRHLDRRQAAIHLNQMSSSGSSPPPFVVSFSNVNSIIINIFGTSTFSQQVFRPKTLAKLILNVFRTGQLFNMPASKVVSLLLLIQKWGYIRLRLTFNRAMTRINEFAFFASFTCDPLISDR